MVLTPVLLSVGGGGGLCAVGGQGQHSAVRTGVSQCSGVCSRPQLFLSTTKLTVYQLGELSS